MNAIYPSFQTVDFNFETDAFYKCAPENQQRRGLALIIANKEFKALWLPLGSQERKRIEDNDRRMCAPHDASRLRECLQNLGYEVVVTTDATAEQIEQLFTRIQQGTHIRDDDKSFICAVSSHGTENNMIYGTNRQTVDLIATAYDKLGGLTCLRDKPKIFFIQACRGSKNEKIFVDNVIGTKDDPLPTIAKRSDFFFSYATGPDTHAFRTDSGSIYITVLCTALDTYALKLDLMYIVLKVHRILDAYKVTYENEKRENVSTCMCPHVTTSMRGPFFFTEMAQDRFEKSQQ